MAGGKLILSLLAAAAPAAPAVAQNVPTSAESQESTLAADLADFDRAMVAFDFHEAARITKAMIVARSRTAGPPLPDPLLNGIVGRLLLARGSPGVALAYLNRSRGAAVPPPQRIAARLAQGQAQLLLGDRRSAGATYASLQAEPLDGVQRRRAALGHARAIVGDDPRGALAGARRELTMDPGVPGDSETEWEAELIAAQALSLLGDTRSAAAAADRAWQASAGAPARDHGPLRAALMRAALASAAGDRDALAAMLSLGAVSIYGLDAKAADFLPVCGEEGIKPEDHVTFGIYRSNAGQHLAPLAASRPEAMGPFLDALAGRALLTSKQNQVGGLIFTARCRSQPSLFFDLAHRGAEPLSEWFAANNLFYDPTADSTLDYINRLSSWIEEIAQARGDDYPSLIPLRLQLWEALQSRAAGEGDVEEWQIVDLRRKVRAGMRKLGGGEGLLPGEREEAEDKAMADAQSPEQGLALYRAAFARRSEALPVDLAYTAMLYWLALDGDIPIPMKKKTVEAMLKRFEPKPQDKRRRSLLLRLAGLQHEEFNFRAARASLRTARVADDMCIAMDEYPSVEGHSITDDSYPGDLISHEIEGLTVIDFDVGADGRAAASRIILSSPASLFEPTVGEVLPGFRFKAARSGGLTRNCRGMLQNLRWQLPPEQEEWPEAQFRPPDSRGS